MARAQSGRRIALGSDHGGFELKEQLKRHLIEGGWSVRDCGTDGTGSVDYPVFAHKVARLVSSGEVDRGIVVDRAGIGSAMAANKFAGVRAALCYDLSSARNSREHNNANVLTLGSGLIGPDLALQIVDLWLAADCTVDRHLRRASMIDPSGTAAGDASAPAQVRASAGAGDAQCSCSCGQEDAMDELTHSDVDRIVQRVLEMTGGGAVLSGADPACVFCQVCAESDPDCLRRLVEMGADRVGHRPGGGILPGELARYIDHTLLRPDATREDIVELCGEATKFGFASVCVHPTWVRTVAEQVAGSEVRVCSVVGFPHGANVPETKALEARRAIRDGAREIDMVINVGALKSGDDDLVYRDIRGVTDACMDGRAICKVILETTLLTDDEKVRGCLLAKRARADFVKTSTGFAGGGATAHDVALMAEAVRDSKMGVKASGGIRSYEDATKMIQAGATRLGASAGVRIIKEAKGLTVSGEHGASGKMSGANDSSDQSAQKY